MSARVTRHESGTHQLTLELRQASGEVVRFVVFVLLILAGILILTPRAREAPGFVFAAAAAALRWAVVSTGAKETYTVDTSQGIIEVTAEWLFGRRQRQIALSEVAAVKMAIGSPVIESLRRILHN